MTEQSPSSHRYGVVALLVSLFAITYLDRVCISVAGPRIQNELHIGPVGWGWVTGIFTLAYCIFEIPTGALGDRIGPRRVLTRVVLWWSLFTVLTGTVTSFLPLLLIRFLFGAGEAGAFPNASVVVSRWFSRRQQATMMGVVLMASQLGGALAPLLVIPIQIRFGWRTSFYVFGALGVLWSMVWYIWFRDSPEAKLGLAAPSEEAATAPKARHTLPWATAMGSQSVLAILGLCFCYVYVYNFFQTWLHTFLEKGRGVSESGLLLTALPFALGGLTNLAGGLASDALVRRLGLRNGRRILGVASLAAAGTFTLAAMLAKEQVLTVVFLTLVYGAISFQQTIAFGACLDIGQQYAGAMVGLFNTVGQVGGLLGAVAYGYIVQHTGSYNAPFLPMIVLLFAGSLIWLRLDASRPLTAAPGV
jgi:sugar phosphate permease